MLGLGQTEKGKTSEEHCRSEDTYFGEAFTFT
jgi:hypothetical protein